MLASKPNSGVLYISRNEVGDGHLVGNQLTLPLKELEELNQWLLQNIKVQPGLSSAAASHTHSNTSAQAVAATPSVPANSVASSVASSATSNSPPTRQTLDDVFASRTAAMASPILKTSSPIAATSTSADAVTTNLAINNAMLDLIKVVAQLQRREDKLFSLLNAAGIVLAHIHAKQQRIWLTNDNIDLSQNLKLQPAGNFQADPTQSTDLLQWLWQQATAQAPKLIEVLRPQLSYRITSWVKPSEGADRHDQLKIQAVLENREVTLAQLASLSQCDHNLIKRTVIGLIFAGTMSPSVYQDLQQHLENLPTAPSANTSTKPNEPPAEISQPIQGAAQAIPTPQPTQTPQHTVVTQEVAKSTGNEGMRGFLSRLRSKLGL